MRYSVTILVLGAALAGSPALAQIDLGVGGQAGGNVGVGLNPGATIDSVTGTLDRSVNSVDRTVNGTLSSDLRLATSSDLTSGAAVRDRRGNRVGTVQSVHGDTAVVVKGDKTMHVPVSALYSGASGLVTNLTRKQIEATANANASANASGGADIHN